MTEDLNGLESALDALHDKMSKSNVRIGPVDLRKTADEVHELRGLVAKALRDISDRLKALEAKSE